jgi:hypothetical protein
MAFFASAPEEQNVYCLPGSSRHFCVSTWSGSDRIKKSHWVSEVLPDPVATAPGTDTIPRCVYKHLLRWSKDNHMSFVQSNLRLWFCDSSTDAATQQFQSTIVRATMT